MSESKQIITAQEEPDDFKRYIANLGSKIVFSCHITETGAAYTFVGKFPSNEHALLLILKNFIRNIEGRLND